MPANNEFHSSLPDVALVDYFRNAGDALNDESLVLGGIIRSLLNNQQPVSNKTIILELVAMLEATRDVVEADVLRKTLEIVVGHTPDDM